MTSERKTSTEVQRSNDRLRAQTQMYAAMTGNVDQWRDLQVSAAMWAELDTLGSWDAS